MKGYITNHILYIFEDKAAEIPYVDESVEAIAIQPELLDAFKEANPTYADIMLAYNYQIISVNPKPFAGHTNDDIEVPVVPVSPELAWSSETATVTIGAEDNVFPTLSNPNNVTVTYSSSDTTKATIDSSTGVITLADAGETTISADFVGDDTYTAQTVTYTLTVNAQQ